MSIYKTIHCKLCNKPVKTFDREHYKGGKVPKDEIIDALKKHYLNSHGFWKTGYGTIE